MATKINTTFPWVAGMLSSRQTLQAIEALTRANELGRTWRPDVNKAISRAWRRRTSHLSCLGVGKWILTAGLSNELGEAASKGTAPLYRHGRTRAEPPAMILRAWGESRLAVTRS